MQYKHLLGFCGVRSGVVLPLFCCPKFYIMNTNPINSGGDQSSTTPDALTPAEINATVDYGTSTLFRFSVVNKPEITLAPAGGGTITPPVSVTNGSVPASGAAIATGLTSVEAVQGLNPGLFAFGGWLAANKGDLPFAEAKTRLQGVAALQSESKEGLWLKTFELLTAKDTAGVTDAVVGLLRADNFKREFDALPEGETPATDFANEEQKAFFEMVAEAPLVIPKEQLPVIEPVAVSQPTTWLEPRQQEILNRAQTASVAEFRSKSLAAGLAQFRQAEMDYAAERKKAYEKHAEAYEAIKAPLLDAYDEMVDKLCPDKTPSTPKLPAFPAFQFPAFDINYIKEKGCYGTLAGFIDGLAANTEFCGSFKKLRSFTEKKIKEQESVLNRNSDVLVPKVLKYGEFSVLSNNRPLDNSYAVQLVKLLPEHDKYSLLVTHFSKNATEKLAKVSATLPNGTVAKDSKVIADNDGYKTVALLINELDPQQSSPAVNSFVPQSPDLSISLRAKAENGTLLFRFSDALESDISYYGPRPEAAPAFQALVMDGEPGIDGSPMYGIRKIGILDYMRIEQEVCCYVPGEVSRIENVMAREFRKKLVRDLERTEITTEESEDSENETSTDTTSTDRYEMHKEISQMIAKEQSQQIAVSAGMNASYEFPAGVTLGVTAGTSLNFSNSSSTTNGFNVAESMAKEVTQKATERILKKVSYKRTAKMLREHEETNEHGFDNRGSGQHVTGIYRWVDKIYKNTVYNYGKRLQYEFMLPEPARNFKHWMESNGDSGKDKSPVPVKPLHPDDIKPGYSSFTWQDVKRNTYAQYAAVYGADVEECPASFLRVAKSFSDNPTGKFPKDWDEPRGSFKYEIEIPDGYFCNDFWGIYNHGLGFLGKKQFEPESDIIVDTSHFHIKSIHPDWKLLFNGDVNTTIGNDNNGMYVTKVLPIGISTFNVGGFSLNIVTNCELSTDAYEQWQQKAYMAIMDAYNKKYQAYLDALVANPEPEPVKPDYNFNPGKGRAIEARELKRLIIENITTGLGVTPPYFLNAYAKINDIEGYKMSLNAGFGQYAHYVNFLEKAFEWDLISYQFLQYLYADRTRWGGLIMESAPSDPLFEAFLQSGMAKVTLTVTPGFEKQVLFFLDTGIVPVNDAFVPTGQQSVYTSLVNSLKVNDKKPVGKPWETRVPTDLIILQSDAAPLQQMGLPCVCTDGLANEGLGIGTSALSGMYTNTPDLVTSISTALSSLLTQIAAIAQSTNSGGGSNGGSTGAGGGSNTTSTGGTFKFKKHASLTSADINKILMNDGDGLAKVYAWSPMVPGVKGEWKISLASLDDWSNPTLDIRVEDELYSYSQSQWRAGTTDPVATVGEELLLLQTFLQSKTELQHLTFSIEGGVLLVKEQTIKQTRLEASGMPAYSITTAAESKVELPKAPTAFALGRLIAIDGNYAVISNEQIETYTIEPGKTIAIDDQLFNSAFALNVDNVADINSMLAHIVVPGPSGYVQSLERTWAELENDKYKNVRDQLLGLAIASENNTVTVVKLPFASIVAHLVNKIKQEDSLDNI
jgi:hypothetical protein